MRKLVASSLTIVFLASLAMNAEAAIKPGTSCKKLGLTSNSSGKKYTCIKSGKNLIWNKGVTITKPQPAAATPTPAPTPISTPTQTPSPSPIPSTSPTPTQAPTVPIAKWQETQFRILKELKALKPEKIQELKFVLSPKTKVETASKLQKSYQEPITLLSNLFVNPNPVTFLVMNENEHDWWWQQVKGLGSNMEESWWGGIHCNPRPDSHCGYGSSPNPDGSFHFGQILGSAFSWQDHDYTIAYHESIHVYQLGLMGNRMNALPPWFAEGQANYLGFTFSHQYVSSEYQRRDNVYGLTSKFPETKNFYKQQWADWLMKIDGDYSYTFNNGLGYSVGELLLESLYNDYSYQKIHDWLLSIKSGSNYKDGFKAVFNEDYDQWLSNTAAAYLDSQI